MAINKNFVIKNGVQVSTDLIIGDADTNKVGIGTTVPGYDLHVGVARGSRGGIGATDIVVTGVGTIANLSVTGPSTFAGALDVNSTVDFAADVVFNGTNDITYDQSESALVFNDGAAIRVGTSSDFSIMHDGSDTILRDNGTGDLKLYGSRIEIGGASVDETIAFFTENAGAQLYFNNEEKFQTVAIGATIFGDFIVAGVTTTQKLNVTGVATVGGALSLPDNTKAQFGTGGDLLIYHDSSNSYIDDQGTGDLIIRGSADIKLQSASGENYIIANDTGSVEAYFDNSKKLETTSGGLNVTGITTFSDRINVVSGVSTFQDDAKLTFGAQSDLLIQHDGTNTEIYNKTGNLKIRSNDLDIQDYTNGHSMITADQDGSVDLFYDNYNALQTTPQGINVSGVTTSNRLNISGVSTFTSVGSNLIPDVDGSRNIGAAGSEWQDLFIDGTAKIDALEADTALISDLTNNRVVIVGTSGELEDDANLTFDGAKLNVGSGVTIQPNGGVSITGVATVGTALKLGDDKQARFGHDNDLTISHSGSNANIENDTGDLIIRTTGASSDDIFIDSHDDINLRVHDTVNAIVATGGASVDLYHNGTKQVETTADGILVGTGVSIQRAGGVSIAGITTVNGATLLGSSLAVAGITSLGDDVVFTGAAANITFDQSTDDLIFDDNAKAIFGSSSDGLEIYHQGSYSAIVDSGTGSLILGSNLFEIKNAALGETQAVFNQDGAVELYYDNSKKIETTSGGLNVTGITTISDRLQVTSGISTFYDTTQSTSATTGAVIINGGVGIAKNVNIGGNLTVTGTTTFNGGTLTLGDANTDNIVFGGEVDSNIIPDDDNTHDLGSSSKQWKDIYIHGVGYIDSVESDGGSFGNIQVGETGDNEIDTSTLNLILDSAGGTVNIDDGITVAGVSTFSANIVMNDKNITLGDSDAGDGSDNRASFGAGGDVVIYHDGTDSYVSNATGDLRLFSVGGSADDVLIRAQDDIELQPNNGQSGIKVIGAGAVELYHSNSVRVTTTTDGVDFGGVGAIGIPKGADSDRPSSPAAGDFRYNTENGEFEGYTDSWGAIAGSGGGATEVDTSVSTTSATSTGSFAKADFRSASIIAQITQGSAYQVGRYLVIHDGTTVTTIEESAVATGSMLGTFEGVINGSNVEFRVTMGSSSSATVTTKIDTVTV